MMVVVIVGGIGVVVVDVMVWYSFVTIIAFYYYYQVTFINYQSLSTIINSSPLTNHSLILIFASHPITNLYFN